MLQQERQNDFQEALRLVLDGYLRTVWFCMIGIVRDTSKLVSAGTIGVEIAIQSVVSDEKGNKTPQTINQLVDVPVCFIGGGNMLATFPIAAGDEALLIFADRCHDFWFAKGGVQRPAEPRIHSMSDGFAIVGPRSLARAITKLSTTTAQFRSVDGTTMVEIAGGGVVNIKAPGGLNITGDVNVTGKVTATKEGTFNSIPVSAHVHGGVQPGVSDTGTPIA